MTDVVIDAGTGSYAGCAGTSFNNLGITQCQWKFANDGMFYYVAQNSIGAIRDGTSNTIGVGETINGHDPDNFNAWAECQRYASSFRVTANPINHPPTDSIVPRHSAVKNSGGFASNHTGGANFVFMDGHVDFITENVDIGLYRNLSTRDGGEVASLSGQ